MSQQPVGGFFSGIIQRFGGMLVAPGAVRRELLSGGPGGFPDLLALLALQLLSVHITRIVRSVWFATSAGMDAGLPGLTMVLGVAIKPLILALGGSVLLRLVTPEGRARERTLDQASLCVIPSVAVAVAMTLLSAATDGASQQLLGQAPMALGLVWFLGLLVFFGLEARRELQEISRPEPEDGGACASTVAGWATMVLMTAVLTVNVIYMVRNPDAIRPVTPGAVAPAFTLRDADKRPVILKALRGKVVLVSFWATWCTPCLREMPFLEQLQVDLGPRGLQVLAVNVESPAEVQERLEVIRKRHPGLTFLSGGQPVATRYGVQTLPHLVIVDPRGRVARVQIGTGSEEAIKKATADLL